LEKQIELGVLQREDVGLFEPWGEYWSRWVSAFYFKAYMEAIAKTGLLPKSAEQLKVLLDAHLLEKAIYEVGYELNNRPRWATIPLKGILRILHGPSAPSVPAASGEAMGVV
jgi:maltose alpha-D-glucosyltransferase/alpha-amylase